MPYDSWHGRSLDSQTLYKVILQLHFLAFRTLGAIFSCWLHRPGCFRPNICRAPLSATLQARTSSNLSSDSFSALPLQGWQNWEVDSFLCRMHWSSPAPHKGPDPGTHRSKDCYARIGQLNSSGKKPSRPHSDRDLDSSSCCIRLSECRNCWCRRIVAL